MLIPFYIFSREAEFSQYETDLAKLETLKDEYRTIIERLDKLVEERKLSDFDRTTLLETADDVIREIAKKYQNVVKGMGEVMGGTLLETNARRIKDEGRAEGRIEGQEEKGIQVFLNLIGAGISRAEAQRLAEIGNDLVEKALKLQKS